MIGWVGDVVVGLGEGRSGRLQKKGDGVGQMGAVRCSRDDMREIACALLTLRWLASWGEAEQVKVGEWGDGCGLLGANKRWKR